MESREGFRLACCILGVICIWYPVEESLNLEQRTLRYVYPLQHPANGLNISLLSSGRCLGEALQAADLPAGISCVPEIDLLRTDVLLDFAESLLEDLPDSGSLGVGFHGRRLLGGRCLLF